MTQSELNKAYYRWALQKVAEEAESDYPLLARIRGSIAWQLRECISTLPRSERPQFSAALAGTGLCDLVADKVSESELALRDTYLSHNKYVDAYGFTCVLPYGSLAEKEFIEKVQSGDYASPSAKELKRHVVNVVERIMGKPDTRQHSSITFRQVSSGWTVSLVLDFGRLGREPDYAFTLAGRDGLFLGNISYLAWSGIAGETSWDLISQDVLEDVARGIGEHVGFFVESWRGIVD